MRLPGQLLRLSSNVPQSINPYPIAPQAVTGGIFGVCAINISLVRGALSMTYIYSFDAQAWQSRQSIALRDIFDRAVEQLDVAGVRLLTGSLPPTHENLSSIAQIKLIPIRYRKSVATFAPLALSLSATATNGPGRYIVALRTSGEESHQAFNRLTDKNLDIWRANYLAVGLWIYDSEHMELLNSIEQIRIQKSAMTISGVFLHSSSRYAVQAGLMSMAVLYRSLLDKLSEVSKMARLSTCVLQQLDGQRPSYERIFRP